jgi:hypothetical protein
MAKRRDLNLSVALAGATSRTHSTIPAKPAVLRATVPSEGILPNRAPGEIRGAARIGCGPHARRARGT